MSAGSVIEGAFRLLRDRAGAVAIWALIYLAATIIMWFAMRPFYTAPAGAMAGAMSPSSMFGWMMLIQLASLILFVVLMTAAQRAILLPHEQGLAYLQLGMDEIRMIALSLILIVLGYVGFVLIGAVAVLLLAGAAAAVGMSGAAISAVLVVLLLLGLFVWLEVRLSLAFPLTLVRRKIIIGESWRLTKGRFWSLFLAYLVVFIIIFVMSLAVGLVTMASYFGALLKGLTNPAGAEQAIQQQVAQLGALNLQTIIGWVVGSVAGALTIALSGGAVATAARELIVDHDEVAETFA